MYFDADSKSAPTFAFDGLVAIIDLPVDFPALFSRWGSTNSKVWELIRDIESLQLALSPPPPPPPSPPSSLGLPFYTSEGLRSGVGLGPSQGMDAPAPVVARAFNLFLYRS